MTFDDRLRRPAGLTKLALGDTTLTYVPDGAVQLVPKGWLPATTDGTWAERPEFLDDTGNLVAGIGGLLVEHGDRAMLIDAGFGPSSVPAQEGYPYGAIHGGALPGNLAALGRDPASIESVAFTHLHIDHVGWAWSPLPGGDTPALGSAEYLMAEPEWAARELAVEQGMTREMLDVMAPRVRTVGDGEEIFPGVRVRYAAGHTAGHAAYVITAGGRTVIAFGDALHSPIQVEHPEWTAASDHDTTLSGAARAQLVAELAEPGTIGYGNHFADVVFGEIGPDGRWRPVT
ncbi:MBL fold metallo-hydrolase [Pseudonocardia sp. TRM90224]|uniref:MBL fold metallo-hydrolase n=1 Tax=Pseudonocardia sp. TRM90224 TaxID=2812678 RepID=UPI001E2F5C6C|nr:MBL fold metallo-hydrolase [Pseudonocardia sp. TRM90224]